jgi:hypothetical protein
LNIGKYILCKILFSKFISHFCFKTDAFWDIKKITYSKLHKICSSKLLRLLWLGLRKHCWQSLSRQWPVSPVSLFSCLESRDLIKRHMLRVLDEQGQLVYQCSVCSHISRVSSNLAKHIEARHIVSETGFVCHVCAKVFPSRNARQSHISRQHRKL